MPERSNGKVSHTKNTFLVFCWCCTHVFTRRQLFWKERRAADTKFAYMYNMCLCILTTKNARGIARTDADSPVLVTLILIYWTYVNSQMCMLKTYKSQIKTDYPTKKILPICGDFTVSLHHEIHRIWFIESNNTNETVTDVDVGRQWKIHRWAWSSEWDAFSPYNAQNTHKQNVHSVFTKIYTNTPNKAKEMYAAAYQTGSILSMVELYMRPEKQSRRVRGNSYIFLRRVILGRVVITSL